MSITAFLPIIVSGVGLVLLFRLRFFFIIHPLRTARLFLSSLSERENRRSLCLALAGTLGVGNIFGVAAGIMIGGAGSVFWLLISGIFSMVIKYSETLLATDLLTEEGGGMQLVIRASFGRLGRTLSGLYAVLCLSLALLMGSAIQSRAAYDVTHTAFGVSPFIYCAVFTALLLISVIGGGDKIEKITAFIIPLTTIVYIIVAFSAIFRNFSSIPSVLKIIARSAAAPRAGLGGVVGYIASSSVKEGFCRGILSNEAGVGTSAMAHSRAKKRPPVTAGLYGMCEVFFDTVLICPLTALMILTAVPDISKYSTPMSLVFAAVSSCLGGTAGIFFTLSILAFAYSTVTCWFYYGSECAAFLFKGRGRFLFAPLFFLFVTLGAVMSDRLLLSFTDVIILLMTVLTLSVIIKKLNRINDLTLKSRL